MSGPCSAQPAQAEHEHRCSVRTGPHTQHARSQAAHCTLPAAARTHAHPTLIAHHALPRCAPHARHTRFDHPPPPLRPPHHHCLCPRDPTWIRPARLHGQQVRRHHARAVASRPRVRACWRPEGAHRPRRNRCTRRVAVALGVVAGARGLVMRVAVVQYGRHADCTAPAAPYCQHTNLSTSSATARTRAAVSRTVGPAVSSGPRTRRHYARRDLTCVGPVAVAVRR
eukprot:3941305-Rhodomonas_salina.2